MDRIFGKLYHWMPPGILIANLLWNKMLIAYYSSINIDFIVCHNNLQKNNNKFVSAKITYSTFQTADLISKCVIIWNDSQIIPILSLLNDINKKKCLRKKKGILIINNTGLWDFVVG